MRKLPPIGMRMVKTAVSVMLCLLLADLFGLPRPVYACMAAVIVTKENVNSSFKQGVARVLSTVVGCLFALIIMLFEIRNEYLLILMLGIGCILTIYFCVLIKHPDAAALSALIFMMLVLTHSGDKYIFTITRFTETVAGIIVAIGVNAVIKPLKKSMREEGGHSDAGL